MGEGQQKYQNNINAQKKEEKTGTDQFWQAQTKESVVSFEASQNARKSLKFDASSSKSDVSQRGLS